MLATNEQVKQAMWLSLNAIRKALELGGEPDTDKEIIEVAFCGFNGDSFVYEITFPTECKCFYTTGKVFVKLKRPAFGEIYEFIATH